MTNGPSKYSAAASMVGYLYQCREALLLAIEESARFPNRLLCVEKFDDVSFETAAGITSQFQLKHHSIASSLTDASSDLWKTLRIWSEQIVSNPQALYECKFSIITTATAPKDSVAAKLRVGRNDNDEAEALDILSRIAASSSNKATTVAREAFLSLPSQMRKDLVAAIVVHDNAPTITDVRSEIEERLAFASPAQHVAKLVDHLEGWWFATIVKALTDASAPPISLLSLRQKIDEIASQFRMGDLMLHQEVSEVPDAELASDNHIFVKQMKCVGLSDPVVELGKRDYYRASAQRTAWARENVLLDGESSRYDEALIERWQSESLAQQDTADLSSDDLKKVFGRTLYHWANRSELPFRNRHERWLCTGSYQILADSVRVGWHPDYQALFSEKKSKGDG
ncbi:ABC-three component system protein [Pelagibius sp. 7325]|uniref:ABC-three component system protein n=1 Tax=Pelagibius sp. 7325 TaxID=3131994 RepID=UPI0030EC8D3E